MPDTRRLGRRDFLRRSTSLLALGLSGGFPPKARPDPGESIKEAARIVGRLPRRRLGPSGREVSALVGAGDLAPALREAAILCGVNFWHKANRWSRNEVPEAILKNREAHYCQVTVDRIGGNHESGLLNEEAHYRYVKEAVRRSGLGYFDDMQLHFGYHNEDEVKNDRNFVRAFERLKREGLVRHLCLSQHGYAGNPRTSRGQSAAEVLTAVVEDGLFEHAQFIYSYGQEESINAFLNFARKKGFGTIAMKTARGLGRMKKDKRFMDSLPTGTAPHHALVRWLTTAAEIDAVVMRVRNLDEFAESFSGAGRSLREVDVRALDMMTARADRTACRLCTACQPHCPHQVPVAEILRFERYALDDGDLDKAKSLYRALDCRADACVGCGTCAAHCPQGLSVPEKLASVHSLLFS